MKKPLQTEKAQFLISSNGRLIGWGAADVKNLIKNSNRAKVEHLKSKEHPTIADAECIFAQEWFEALLKKGATQEVVNRLNSRIANVHYQHVLIYSPKGLHWRRIANGDQIDDPEISVAYGVAHLLTAGALEGLKCCRMPNCQKYFIGRPNAKWCSKACGSKFRVNQKRKRDRA